MKKLILNILLIPAFMIMMVSCNKDNNEPQKGTVTDVEGNAYETVQIGTQIWMAENLKTTKLNDGSAILNVSDDSEWEKQQTSAYCWYDNKESNKETWGALYNWVTVNTDKLCPTGWHVPTDEEWTTLENFLGGSKTAGGAMKEKGTEHWLTPNTGATNEIGFTGLPAGTRYVAGTFSGLGKGGGWWSSTEDNAKIENSFDRWIVNNSTISNRYSANKRCGTSVRCIKD